MIEGKLIFIITSFKEIYKKFDKEINNCEKVNENNKIESKGIQLQDTSKKKKKKCCY